MTKSIGSPEYIAEIIKQLQPPDNKTVPRVFFSEDSLGNRTDYLYDSWDQLIC